MEKNNNIIGDAFDKIIEMSGINQKRRANDYIGEDGLRRCGVCNFPKEKKIEVPMLGQRFVPVICKCEHDAFVQEKERERLEEEKRRIDELVKYSLVDNRFKESTFDNAQQNDENKMYLTAARNYCERFADMKRMNKGLLLYGEPSTGKTFIAYCIANDLIKRCVPVMVTSIVRLTSATSLSKGEEEFSRMIEKMNSAHLLIIDDLGTERETDYKMEQVFNVIDSRYNAKKPMIITTNLTMEEMKNTTDIRKRRVFERIFEVCYPLRIVGKSWRRETARNDYQEMKSILFGGMNEN